MDKFNSGRTQKKEDVIDQGVIDDLNLIACVTEDFTFETAQTQIDNKLVPIKLIHNLKEAHMSTGGGRGEKAHTETHGQIPGSTMAQI
eukprot:3905229-Pleurochrysis_carterae.AAC.3